MIVFDRKNIAHLIFLELISITPLIIILGNIVPPFPIKIHFIGMGLIFLNALWILMTNAHKKWVLYVAGFFVLIQIAFNFLDIKNVIDFFFGPFVLIVMLDLLVNNKVPRVLLDKYQKRFYRLLFIPITIAVLQFFGIFPITFWNADYVNYSYQNGLAIPRPNGFLYHGAELSIIICFVALFQYFKSETKSFWMLLLLIAITLTTYFKAILGCVSLLFLFYLTFVNRGVLSSFRVVSKKRIFGYGVVLLLVFGVFVFQFLSTVHHYTGYYFPSQLLTGRGAIWNIYLDAIKEYSFWNYLFGSGMGSGPRLFYEYASPKTWYWLTVRSKLAIDALDPHNAILSVFVNSGVAGLAFFFFLFNMIFNQIKKWRPSEKWNKKVFIAIFVIPLLTIGVTIPIYEMAIFWVCLGFLFYKWCFYTDNENKVNA